MSDAPDFRRAYAELVASLVRRVGVAHLERAEDAAQTALLAALQTWTSGGAPADPPAWLFRVAWRALLGDLRQHARRRRILAEQPPAPNDEPPAPVFLAAELPDDLLRLLFVCGDDALPPESQLVLALKVLSGLEVREIALRLFLREATVHKRLSRARLALRRRPPDLDVLDPDALATRLPGVQRVLYVLFTEGHLASQAEAALRRDLCDEAVRLATLLAEHPRTCGPESAALLALFLLHRARLPARVDPTGGLVLLEEQDRDRWDRDDIALGLRWLAESARGDVFSRWHAEAEIAAAHALAPSTRETDWERIVACYEQLERAAPSPLHTLNRALAVAEWRGPTAGLEVLRDRVPPSWLAGSHWWSAVLSDLHRRRGDADLAARHREIALAAAPSPAIRAALARRLA